jgi:transposase InsO family protein
VQVDTTPIEVRPGLRRVHFSARDMVSRKDVLAARGKGSSCVERSHLTHQEEFYDLVEIPDSLAEHNALLEEWERVYNEIRPHQALGYLTPNEYLQRCQTDFR